jgi:multidrug efflux pump subunit AcrA (membrane-fusion protein)
MAKQPTLVAMAALLAIFGCEDEREEPEVIRPVRYVVVEGSDAATHRTFSGVSKAGQESRLSFQVSGQVLDVPINVGDTVK